MHIYFILNKNTAKQEKSITLIFLTSLLMEDKDVDAVLRLVGLRTRYDININDIRLFINQ